MRVLFLILVISPMSAHCQIFTLVALLPQPSSIIFCSASSKFNTNEVLCRENQDQEIWFWWILNNLLKPNTNEDRRKTKSCQPLSQDKTNRCKPKAKNQDRVHTSKREKQVKMKTKPIIDSPKENKPFVVHGKERKGCCTLYFIRCLDK